MGFSTDCIHAGNEPEPATGSVSFPIYQTSTYVQQGLGQHKGFEYGRTQNPTRSRLEENLTVLEGGCGARAFAAGAGHHHLHHAGRAGARQHRLDVVGEAFVAEVGADVDQVHGAGIGRLRAGLREYPTR